MKPILNKPLVMGWSILIMDTLTGGRGPLLSYHDSQAESRLEVLVEISALSQRRRGWEMLGQRGASLT